LKNPIIGVILRLYTALWKRKEGPKMRIKLVDRVEQKRKCATKVFCFTLPDIAAVAGKSLYAVKRAVYSGKLDPRDLRSIVEYGRRNVGNEDDRVSKDS